ncbi:MAG TPA: subtype I-C CRISPR-associated endonuclease Cas1 [Phycisphaerales bacterium]|nr:subtype I-C CRISPR-associated endonuclease Cas1 [Phycisphaerales bacterium]
MKHHLNTLFVFTQGAYLAKDGQAVAVRVEDEVRFRVPIHNLGGIVCFGRVGVSPALMALAAEAGASVSFCTEHGRFMARVSGFTPGNVLLRRTQYRWADDPERSAGLARSFVLGKLLNARTVLLRAARDRPDDPGNTELAGAARRMAATVDLARAEPDLDRVRGYEGEGSQIYFGAFNHLITSRSPSFVFNERSRRPPLDAPNALLSFLYAMLAHDARTACESAGLDGAVGFLHRDRPGRPGLALDLMEEFRAFLADRLALSLMNRGQVTASGFEATASGAVLMNEATRKAVVKAYQERKQEEIVHPFLNERTTVGLLVHLQARLLARHLRGDLDAYPPFVWK